MIPLDTEHTVVLKLGETFNKWRGFVSLVFLFRLGNYISTFFRTNKL